VPDPERAPLIARALQEFATGRFTKQEVIARMTEAGLRTRRGLVLSPQSLRPDSEKLDQGQAAGRLQPHEIREI